MINSISVRISKEAHHRLKVFCAEHGFDMQVVANLAVMRYLERLEAEDRTTAEVSPESHKKIAE
jgi:hypothetical protein